MQKKGLRISIVIPVYNEQEHLAACLNAIAKQNLLPFEVIVADNNSTDRSREIARSFSFTTVISVPKQGVVYARDAGFNLARGNIIGRIDADTILPPDWTTRLVEIFASEDIEAVSGRLHFYDIGLSSLIDKTETYWCNWIAQKMSVNNRVFLLGANMAIRRAAWQKVKPNLCHNKRYHEDLDLALHLSEFGLKVSYSPMLLANMSARRIDSGLIKLWNYSKISPNTYREHNASDYLYMIPVIIIVLVFYLPLRFLYRSYDHRTNSYSLKQLFSSSTRRINPVTLV